MGQYVLEEPPQEKKGEQFYAGSFPSAISRWSKVIQCKLVLPYCQVCYLALLAGTWRARPIPTVAAWSGSM